MRENKTCRLLPALALLVASAPLPAEPPDTVDLPHAFEAGWRGEKTCEVLFEDASVRVARCTFPPGVGHEKHFHRPHFGYALSGGTQRIEDANGRREVAIEAGTRWSSDTLTVHEVLNTGNTTTSYLIVEPLAGDPPRD